MAVHDNTLVIAIIAIAAVYMVVKSGEQDVKKADDAMEEDRAQGVDENVLADEHPSPQREASRGVCARDLSNAIQEYRFLKHYEQHNEAELQQLHQFPPEIWKRIERLQQHLRGLAERAERVYLRRGSYDSKAFWNDFDKLWQGQKMFGDRELQLRQSVDATPKGRDAPHIDEALVTTNAHLAELVAFVSAPAPVKVDTFNPDMFREMMRFAFDQGNQFRMMRQLDEGGPLFGDGAQDMIWIPTGEDKPLALTNHPHNQAFESLPRDEVSAEERAAADANRTGLTGNKPSSDAAPMNVEPSGPVNRYPDPMGESRSADRGEGEEETFNSAPKKIEHQDEPPAPPPASLGGAPPVVEVTPTLDTAIQQDFNSSGESGINLGNKPAQPSELDPFTAPDEADHLQKLRGIAIDQEGFFLSLSMLGDMVRQAIARPPTPENKAAAQVTWQQLRNIVPEQYRTDDAHMDIFKALAYNSHGQRLASYYPRAWLEENIAPMPTYKAWLKEVKEIGKLYKTFKKKNVRDEDPEDRGKRQRKEGNNP